MQRHWRVSAWFRRSSAGTIKDTGQVASVDPTAVTMYLSSGRTIQTPRFPWATWTGRPVSRTALVGMRCVFHWRRHTIALCVGTIWTVHGCYVPCVKWICKNPSTSVLDRSSDSDSALLSTIMCAYQNVCCSSLYRLCYYNANWQLTHILQMYTFLHLCWSSGWYYRANCWVELNLCFA